jgi:protein bicaudal C
MDCISSLTGSNGCNLNSCFKGSDLPELFSKLGLGKYTDVFQQQEVSQLPGHLCLGCGCDDL